MSESVEAEFVIEMPLSGNRLDQALVELMPDYSRSRLQQWIKQGAVLVNGAQLKPKEKVKAKFISFISFFVLSQFAFHKTNQEPTYGQTGKFIFDHDLTRGQDFQVF